MIQFFKIWTAFWFIGIGMFLLRPNGRIKLIEALKILVQPTTFTFLMSVIMVYFIIPISIPYSIKEIIQNKKEEQNGENQ